MSQHDDPHLTTEDLSAFLDKQLPTEELNRCKIHLATCGQCQQALAELQQTVTLLHALPLPVLPRSFVLPTGSGLAFLPARTTQQPDSTNLRSSRRIWSPSLNKPLRFISGIAAVIGVFFMLSGLLTTLSFSRNSYSAVPSSANNTKASSGTSNEAKTPAFLATATITIEQTPGGTKAPAAGHPQETQNPTVGKTDTPKDTDINNQDKGPSFSLPFFDLSTPGGRLSLGLLLCIAGGMGFTLFNQRLKQQRK